MGFVELAAFPVFRALIETLPLLWLIGICIGDAWMDFSLQISFCKIVKELQAKGPTSRGHPHQKNQGQITSWACPHLTQLRNQTNAAADTSDGCPIYYIFNNHSEEVESDCPNIFSAIPVRNPQPEAAQGVAQTRKDEFWMTIKKGFDLLHQAAYFEVLFTQFFILALLSTIPANTLVLAVLAIAFFIFPYLFATIVGHKPLSILHGRYRRLSIAVVCWVIAFSFSLIEVQQSIHL